MRKVITAAVVGPASALILAPAAYASNDTAFLGCLDQNGVPYTDKNTALGVYHQVEKDLHSGVPPNQVNYELNQAFGRGTANLTMYCVYKADGLVKSPYGNG